MKPKLATGHAHGRKADPAAAPRPTSARLGLLAGETARAVERAGEEAARLESAAERLSVLAAEFVRDGNASVLLRSSHGIRSIVGEALGILAELQRVAGQLDVLAMLKVFEPDPGTTPES